MIKRIPDENSKHEGCLSVNVWPVPLLYMAGPLPIACRLEELSAPELHLRANHVPTNAHVGCPPVSWLWG